MLHFPLQRTELSQIFQFYENGDPPRISTSERAKRSPIFQFYENGDPARFPQFDSGSERTGLSPIFSQPEMTDLSRMSKILQTGNRRPYRWWKARACIEENDVWHTPCLLTCAIGHCTHCPLLLLRLMLLLPLLLLVLIIFCGRCHRRRTDKYQRSPAKTKATASFKGYVSVPFVSLP